MSESRSNPKPFFVSIFLRALPLWATLWILDLGLRFIPGVRPPLHPIRPIPLALDLLLTATLSLGLQFSLALLPGKIRKWAQILTAGAVALLVCSSGLVYLEFGEFLSVGMLKPVVDNPASIPGYIWVTFRSGMGWPLAGVWLLFAALLSASSRIGPSPARPAGFTRAGAFALLLLLTLILANSLRVRSEKTWMSQLSSWIVAVQETRRLSGSNLLYHSPQRKKPLPAKRPQGYDIVIVVAESWGADELDFFPQPSGRDTRKIKTRMPRLEHWLEEEGDRITPFPRGYSNSSDTKVSVPLLMTGISPERSSRELHEAPFVWDWASAAGLETLFVTSERFQWCGLIEFFGRGFPGAFLTADEFDSPLVNDLGIDDAITAREFSSRIAGLPEDRNFLGIYYPNATHSPYQTTSRYFPHGELQGLERFDAAHLILDRAIAEVIGALEKSGRLERTFLFFTGDHGSGHAVFGKESRLSNTRDAVTRVPWMIRAPEDWIRENPQAAANLKANQAHPVSNLDILPSVASLLAFDSDTASLENKQLLTGLSGASVFGNELKEDREILSLVPIRRSQGIPIGVFTLRRGRYRLHFNSATGPELHDHVTDPDLETNLWNDINHRSARESLLKWAAERKELDRILQEGRNGQAAATF